MRQHIVDVCREIVEKYDVDGLVFDDYFYPDRLPLGEGYDFDLWSQACAADENLSGMTQADWRRHNVNQTIRDVHDMIRATRPWVRFGGFAGRSGRRKRCGVFASRIAVGSGGKRLDVRPHFL